MIRQPAGLSFPIHFLSTRESMLVKGGIDCRPNYADTTTSAIVKIEAEEAIMTKDIIITTFLHRSLH